MLRLRTRLVRAAAVACLSFGAFALLLGSGAAPAPAVSTASDVTPATTAATLAADHHGTGSNDLTWGT
ncbi:hypothetical protein [Kitasatospora sp. NPDC093558]|uniref:hypothetical protein n=1 Tax=Kitasatospora sp. NPDC093558 TaxID=3155201 RepID=UPI0034415681